MKTSKAPFAVPTQSRATASIENPSSQPASKKSNIAKSKYVFDEAEGRKFIKCLGHIMIEAEKLCDDDCMIQFLQKNGSHEAHKYIAEGFFKSRGQEIKNIKNPQTKSGRFHLALYHAGLLETNHKITEHQLNYPLAVSILEGLLAEEPQNAALYLYLAVIAFNQNELQEAKKILQQMNKNANYYDEYLVAWKEDFMRSEYALNSALMIESFGLYKYPRHAPDLYAVSQMQEKLDFDFKPLGQIMIKNALDHKLAFTNEPDWDHLQYDMGLRMLYYSKKNPKWRENPARKLPTSGELLDERKKKELEQFSDRVQEIRSELQIALAQNCSIEVYDEWLRKYPEGRKYGR